MIRTKFLPATNFLGSRIQAKFEGKVLVCPYAHEHDAYKNHVLAAKQVSGLPEVEEVSQSFRGYCFREPETVRCLGYRNHETAQVALQISNERPLYDRAKAWAESNSGAVVPWCGLVEAMTGREWQKGFVQKVPGKKLQWDSPLICRKEILDHVRSLIEDH